MDDPFFNLQCTTRYELALEAQVGAHAHGLVGAYLGSGDNFEKLLGNSILRSL